MEVCILYSGEGGVFHIYGGYVVFEGVNLIIGGMYLGACIWVHVFGLWVHVFGIWGNIFGIEYYVSFWVFLLKFIENFPI